MKGFQGTSLLDFPGRVAALIFTGGCNLSCPFCHNGELVLHPDAYPTLPLDELLADLDQRGGFIDGVVISGGEPTIDTGLPAFLSRLRDRRLQIKLDTNGLRPEVVAALLRDRLVDYVALDVKTTPQRYGELHDGPVALERLQETIGILKQAEVAGEVEVEFRTTCIPQLVGDPEIRTIGSLLTGARLWVLQQYRPEHAMQENWQASAYSPEQLRTLLTLAEPFVEQARLRGL